MTVTHHTIPDADFTALARGGGGARVVNLLARAQLTKHMLLLHGVVVDAERDGHPTAGAARRAFRLLGEVQREDRAAAEAVLRHPAVGSWVWRTDHALHDTAASPADPAASPPAGPSSLPPLHPPGATSPHPPRDLTVQTELAKAVWHDGSPHGALAILRAVLAGDGDTPEAMRARGQILADLGEAGEALRAFDRVRPVDPPTLAARSLALATLQREAEAFADLEVALAEAGGHGLVCYFAARALLRLGERERARRVLQVVEWPRLTAYQWEVLERELTVGEG